MGSQVLKISKNVTWTNIRLLLNEMSHNGTIEAFRGDYLTNKLKTQTLPLFSVQCNFENYHSN